MMQHSKDQSGVQLRTFMKLGCEASCCIYMTIKELNLVFSLPLVSVLTSKIAQMLHYHFFQSMFTERKNFPPSSGGKLCWWLAAVLHPVPSSALLIIKG